jgi:polysaccharide export outer membrane protein
LNINVRTLNPDAALQFNPQAGQGQQNMRLGILKVNGYLVKKDGTIDFPELGAIPVKGKSTKEVQHFLEKELQDYLKNPIVSVRVINYKFTVLGEVNRPGTYEIVEENYTLLQALGQAGGLTINGKRKNVLVIRHEDGERIAKRIDLTSSDWMNSPFYFVKQNDQIYVEPNSPQVKRAGFIGNASTVLSALSVILSAIVIIFR